MTIWFDRLIMGDTSLLDIALFVLTIIVAVIIARMMTSLIRDHLDDTVGKRSSKRVASLMRYAILAVALLIGTTTFLHIDLNAAILSLGIMGVAVAFATQQIIQNAVAGVLISITKPIQVEDWVEVGLAPTTGICRVRDIRLTSTELREKGGRIAIVPNSQIINGKVINYTRSGFTALEHIMTVRPVIDLATVRRIVLEEADDHPDILPVVDEPHAHSLFDHSILSARQAVEAEALVPLSPIVNVLDIQESRMNLQIKVWIRDAHRADEIRSSLLEALRVRFKEEGIDLRDP